MWIDSAKTDLVKQLLFQASLCGILVNNSLYVADCILTEVLIQAIKPYCVSAYIAVYISRCPAKINSLTLHIGVIRMCGDRHFSRDNFSIYIFHLVTFCFATWPVLSRMNVFDTKLPTLCVPSRIILLQFIATGLKSVHIFSGTRHIASCTMNAYDRRRWSGRSS